MLIHLIVGSLFSCPSSQKYHLDSLTDQQITYFSAAFPLPKILCCFLFGSKDLATCIILPRRNSWRFVSSPATISRPSSTVSGQAETVSRVMQGTLCKVCFLLQAAGVGEYFYCIFGQYKHFQVSNRFDQVYVWCIFKYLVQLVLHQIFLCPRVDGENQFYFICKLYNALQISCRFSLVSVLLALCIVTSR